MHNTPLGNGTTSVIGPLSQLQISPYCILYGFDPICIRTKSIHFTNETISTGLIRRWFHCFNCKVLLYSVIMLVTLDTYVSSTYILVVIKGTEKVPYPCNLAGYSPHAICVYVSVSNVQYWVELRVILESP